MRALLIVPSLMLLAACGDPAAAAVLENAAENGMNPQQALQQAGNAQVSQSTNVSAQARPNLPGSPNPAQGGKPPEKVVVPANQQ